MALCGVLLLGACAGDEPATPREPSPASTPSTTAAPSSTTSSSVPSSAGLLRAACDGELVVTDAGALPADLTSVSGLAAGRRSDDVVWAVEDSFEPAQLVALGTDGRERGRVTVDAGPLSNLDWEAVATTVTAEGTPRVVIGDIGDNLAIRPSVRFLVLDEPLPGDTTVTPEVVEATYQDAAGATVRPNAEAMAVLDGTIWVLDKTPDGPTTVYRLVTDQDDPTRGVLTAAGTVDLAGEQATALDVSPDGSVMALRTNRSLRLFAVPEGADPVAVLAGESCEAPTPPEAQGEAVAVLAGDAGMLSVSEDERGGGPVPLHRIAGG